MSGLLRLLTFLAPSGGRVALAVGLGLLIAQVVLVRNLEADPALRDLIGGPD